MGKTALKDGEMLFLNQRVIYFSHSDFWQLAIELNIDLHYMTNPRVSDSDSIPI